MGATHPVALGEHGLAFSGGAAERLRTHFVQETAQRKTLTEAVRRAPVGLLEPFEKALLELGEETGTLDRSLRLLGQWYESQHRLLRKLWSRSTYPLFLTLMAVILLPLPLVFRGETAAYFMSAGTGLAIWFAFGGNVVYLAARTRAGRAKWVRARLARSLTTAIEAGASLERVIELAVAAAGSPALESCVKRVPITKRRTQPLSETFRGCPDVPEELIGAMRVAESTGRWSDSVGRLGQLYEEGF